MKTRNNKFDMLYPAFRAIGVNANSQTAGKCNSL